MTDLAVVPDYRAEIERAADPAAYVIQACERAKVWLSHVLEHGDIEQIVELKSQAEAIRVYTMSKQLGHDAQLAAAEIVRRAERGIGLAIRKGQEAGRIAKKGDPPPPPTKPYERVRQGRREVVMPPLGPQVLDANLRSPSEFLAGGEDTTKTYAVTDGVTDEEFEEAISEAKAEGNLSRANIVRKVRKEENGPMALSTREVRTQITAANAQRRAIDAATISLSGVCFGLRQIEDLHPDITSEEAAQWVDDLSETRLVIERLIKRLKERTNSADN